MRLLLTGIWCFLAIGCVSHDPRPLKTEVVTYPEGAMVEFNGRTVGRAPAAVILPQDSNGKLTERVVLRAVPNTAQSTLLAQTRVFEPGSRSERIPNRILIDLTLRDPNAPPVAFTNQTASAKTAGKTNRVIRARQTDRGKPTQPVGLDRWNPGIY